MGNNNKKEDKSRRWFLSFFLSGSDTTPPGENPGKSEKVKMLTADGKLVEVDKNILAAAMKDQKASHKEILTWMKNPSKEKNS